MKTRKNKIIEFDNDGDIYIRKNITGTDDNCLIPFMTRKITVHRDNPVFCSRGNCLIEKPTKTLLFAGGEFVIPDDGSVEIIGIHAFAGRLDFDYGYVLDIPAAVKHIFPQAFYMTKINNVTLHDGLKTIGTCAFAYSELKRVCIPRTVKRIAEDAFLKCDLRSITSHSPHYISKNGCLIEKSSKTLIAVTRQKEIVIPDGVERIASGVFFREVQQIVVHVPASVRKIQGHNFYDCYNRIYSPLDKNSHIDRAVTVLVRKNTYAEYFAKKHNLHYFVKND